MHDKKISSQNVPRPGAINSGRHCRLIAVHQAAGIPGSPETY